MTSPPEPTTTRATRLHLYQRQAIRLQQRIDDFQQRSNQLAQLRLGLFLTAVLLSSITFITWGAEPWLVVTAVALIPFFIAVILHRRLQTAVTRLTYWQQQRTNLAARMTLDWAALPEPAATPIEAEHPFAADLDLLGPRSLMHLLDTTIAAPAHARLSQWLLTTTPDPATILTRQTRVQELLHRPVFRHQLTYRAAQATAAAGDKFSDAQIHQWLDNRTEPATLRPLLWLLSGLALLNGVLFLLYLQELLPAIWLLPWVLYVALYATLGLPRIGSLFNDALFLEGSLTILQGVFGFLERVHDGRISHIAELCQPFYAHPQRPSHYIRRARRVAAGVGLQQNPLIGLMLNAILPWNLLIAYQLARCRTDLATELPRWLDVWYELEALSALATFGWLNPETTFPQLTPEATIHFAATELGHPLIPAHGRIHNSFTINQTGSVTIITGSNMAGKSSFLRTLGINLALAYAGGPVMAQSLHTTWLRLYTSIRISDSLQDGFSFFYAEVRRLERLLTALNEPDAERPLLFLIDEIFRGTNNRERLIGSRAYIRALASGNGAGCIATHDLELIHLADENPTIRNMHFRDDVQDGRMIFDYKLHPGPCPTTNALKIMTLAGLPVAPPANS
jgi:ABC-type multidrug transport system fused ATPase/permease subunit